MSWKSGHTQPEHLVRMALHPMALERTHTTGAAYLASVRMLQRNEPCIYLLHSSGNTTHATLPPTPFLSLATIHVDHPQAAPQISVFRMKNNRQYCTRQAEFWCGYAETIILTPSSPFFTHAQWQVLHLHCPAVAQPQMLSHHTADTHAQTSLSHSGNALQQFHAPPAFTSFLLAPNAWHLHVTKHLPASTQRSVYFTIAMGNKTHGCGSITCARKGWLRHVYEVCSADSPPSLPALLSLKSPACYNFGSRIPKPQTASDRADAEIPVPLGVAFVKQDVMCELFRHTDSLELEHLMKYDVKSYQRALHHITIGFDMQ
ncbi:hypothetical protein B0H10DRAFT_1946478 [Mycena sp. CBHHK59/15]|nr:hypothetical protein B0H10DRAFT_1946478 [Mycena sp. CBHHK59/15]